MADAATWVCAVWAGYSAIVVTTHGKSKARVPLAIVLGVSFILTTVSLVWP